MDVMRPRKLDRHGFADLDDEVTIVDVGCGSPGVLGRGIFGRLGTD
jgi:hypothetical protein